MCALPLILGAWLMFEARRPWQPWGEPTIIGTGKTAVFTVLGVVMVIVVGMGYGHFFAGSGTLHAHNPPPAVTRLER